MLTVVVDEDDQGGADHPGEQVHHGQAEHRRLEQPLPHRHLHVDDRAVGEDGEEAAEAHGDEEEVEDRGLGGVLLRVRVHVLPTGRTARLLGWHCGV